MSAADNLVLLFSEGEYRGQAFSVPAEEISIGRSRSNQIVVSDEQVSRRHVALRTRGSDLVVEDLDSAHGSYLNGNRLRGILSLNEGDELRIGDQVLIVLSREEVKARADVEMLDIHQLHPRPAAVSAQSIPAEPEADAATRYTGSEEEAEDLDATRYHEAIDVHVEDDDAKTRVLEDAATRMLDVDELVGLQPSAKPARFGTKAIVGILVTVVVVIGAGIAAIRYAGQGSDGPAGLINYADQQYWFGVRYPSTWEKTSIDPDAVIMFQSKDNEEIVAYMKVFVDQSLAHETTGLTDGFTKYLDIMGARHDDFLLLGYKTLDMNRLRLIQYGFRSRKWSGFGLFTYSGVNRFDVEVATLAERYPNDKRMLLDLLRTFALRDPQQYIDFELADEEIRRHALRDPAGLSREARLHLELARDRMTRRTVRADNLYRAIAQYRLCLTKATALSTRPDFYEEAARELLQANEQLTELVEEQWFKIRQAEKLGNWDAVEWELTKIKVMVPDRTDPIYRRAEERLKALGYM